MRHWIQPAVDSHELPYIFEEGEVNSNYSVNVFEVDPEAGEPTIQILLIGRFEGRDLVALPQKAWHRKVDRRIMPAGSLLRPTLLEVAACRHSNMEEIIEDTYIKVWVGYLKEEFNERIQTHLEEFNVTYDFDSSEDMLMPAAAALVSAAQEHFAFFSAVEGEDQAEVPMGEGGDGEDLQGELASGSQDLGPRVLNLEKAMHGVQQGIDQLLAMQMGQQPQEVEPTAAAKRKPALKKTGVASPPAKVTFSQSLGASAKARPGNPYPSLDPAVVQAAVRAGVDEQSLKEMESLISRNPKGLKVKETNPLLNTDPLSEEEEDDVGSQEVRLDQGGTAAGDPLTSTLVKLTTLVDLLAEDKKKKSSVTRLDAALDSVSGTTSDSSALGLGKKAAAARRALRQTFRDHPEEIHQLLERLMYEDLLSTTVGPNMATPSLNARAWVEFRSHIGNFKTSAHAAWSAAGIADALRNGDHHRARAMSLLLLLQLDQTAIDKGSWSFSGDLSLEPLPPFNSLSQHQGPNVLDGEQPFSRLLDERWTSITMSHLKDQDEYIQRRRNVGKGAKSLVDDKEEPDPKRRPRPKPKAKAGATQQQDA